MKFILLVSCILAVAFCAPKPQGYKEFDIHHAPAEAALAIPAGAPAGTLEVLLPVNSLRQPIGGAVSGFIKQEIPRGNGEDDEVYYPFGFNVAAPAAPAAAAADPVIPAAVPAAPAAVPAAPVAPVLVVAAPAPVPKGDDEEDEDD
ncbi:uncharacterized protein LOC110013344 [Oryzias latipes]